MRGASGQPGRPDRPVPNPHQRRPMVTDLRGMAPRPAAPAHQPRPYQPQPAPAQYQPVHHQPQHHHAPGHHPAPQPLAQPQAAKAKKSALPKLITALVVVILVIASGWLVIKNHGSKKTSSGYFPATITASQFNLAVYYPKGLPDGFNVSSYKIVKQNVLTYVVSNSNNDQFYVTIQALPSSDQLAAYKKKISHSTTYAVPAGTALVGTAGSQLAGSIETTKNVWILLNSTALSRTADMEVITKAFQPASL